MAIRKDAILPQDFQIKTPVATERQRATVQERRDGWSNLASGVGTKKDKRIYGQYNSTFLDKNSCISMYNGDGLVARIIDTIPDDMMREWGYFQNDNKTVYDEGVISKEMRRLKSIDTFSQAVKWARVTGGALIYIGAMDGSSPGMPLNLKKIKTIEFLRVHDLGSIKTSESEWDDNPQSPTFGKIIRYKVEVTVNNKKIDMLIHHTRCIPIFGIPVPPSTKEAISLSEVRYWGVPLMQKIYNDVRDFRGAFDSVGNILQEFIIGKYKFADLDEMLQAKNDKALQARIAGIETTKSSINAVLLGTDEEYTRDAATVTGIPDLLDRFMMMLSAITGIPVTKLFGRSASGLNATGEGDNKNYYDQLHASQISLTPYIEQFGTILASWLGIGDADISWTWNPLIQLSEEQKVNVDRIVAESERTRADADQRMLQEGVILPEEVRAKRYPELPKIVLPDMSEEESSGNYPETDTEDDNKEEPTE